MKRKPSPKGKIDANTVFQTCNTVEGAHFGFENIRGEDPLGQFNRMVLAATFAESDLLDAAAHAGIDLTGFSRWLAVIQKAHRQMGETAQVDAHADDLWPDAYASLRRLRYTIGSGRRTTSKHAADSGRRLTKTVKAVTTWLKPIAAMHLLKQKIKQNDREETTKYDRRVREAFERIKKVMPTDAKRMQGKVEQVAEGEFKIRVEAMPVESNRGRAPAEIYSPEAEGEKTRILENKTGAKLTGTPAKTKKTRWSCTGCGEPVAQEAKPDRCPKCISGAFEKL